MKHTKVVIVGGGFGGVKAALELAKTPDIDVTLISDRDHFTYYPSLYAVATGGSNRQSFVPLSKIFDHTSVKIVVDSIEGYEPQRKLVRGAQGEYSFDKVIFALGVVTSYFGIKGLDTYSFGIKSVKEIEAFRKHIHDEMVSDHKIDKQYVVVGAGPTGVELSASLAHHIQHIASAHHIRHSKIRIKLVEAAPRVLPRMSEDASYMVHKRLIDLGVDVMVNETVEWQDDDEVYVSGRSIPTKTVIWTSGVSNNPFFEAHSDHFVFSPNKKIIVDTHMMANDHTYVIGDNAYTPFSGLAQTALHDALFVTKDIKKIVKKQPRPEYKVVKPPVVVPVGDHWAVLEWNFILIGDYIGHLIRRAADFIGYNDMLPVGLAFLSWRSESRLEYGCQTCQQLSD
ncbi:MAG: FAD-dependent oxidoreductase [Candidatus Saccharimonadales bacterium]